MILKNNKLIILLIFIGGALSDLLYGYLSGGIGASGYGMAISPGQIIRTFIYLLILINLFLDNEHQYIIFLIIISIILVSVFYELVHQISYSHFLSNIVFWFKTLMFIIIYFYFKKGIVNRNFSVDELVKISILTLTFFYLSPIILGQIGMGGLATYAGDVRPGSKGLIASPNTMSILIISLFPYIIFQFLNSRTLINFLLFFLFIASGLFLGTKSVIAICFIQLLFFYKSILFQNRYIMISFLSSISLFIYIIYAYGIFDVYYNTYMMLYENMHKSNLVPFLTSGRSNLADYVFESYYNNNTPVQYLLGYRGYDSIIYLYGKYVEMDIVDLLINYGVVGAFIFYGPFFYKLFSSKKSNYTFSAKISLFGIIIHSIFGGHVAGNAILAPYIALSFLIL